MQGRWYQGDRRGGECAMCVELGIYGNITWKSRYNLCSTPYSARLTTFGNFASLPDYLFFYLCICFILYVSTLLADFICLPIMYISNISLSFLTPSRSVSHRRFHQCVNPKKFDATFINFW